MTLDYKSDSQPFSLCDNLHQSCKPCEMLMSYNSLVRLCISAELGQVVKKELNSVLVWLTVMLLSVEPAEVMGIASMCLQV